MALTWKILNCRKNESYKARKKTFMKNDLSCCYVYYVLYHCIVH